MHHIMFDPLASTKNDGTFDEENDNLRRIYHFLYRHGTEETKEKLVSIGYKGEN